MADTTIGQGFSDYIGTRTKPGQTQLEYYNTQSGQTFGNPQDLANYAGVLSGRGDITSGNVFSVLSQGFTPRAQALDKIGQDLNNYQQQTFDQQTESKPRASSSLADSINTEQGNYDTYLNDYKSLTEKLKALTAPNYQQTYNDIRTQAGVPGLENDYASNQKNIRELPYVNRMNFGNAGVATEGQLSADTAQKGIPLEIQQANLLDRLKLASDFVTNSLNFKSMDYNASRQSLQDAANLVYQTIGLSQSHLKDLLDQKAAEEKRQQDAQQFAYDNRISKPFYDIGGTVFRTSDRMPAHTPQEYVSMGGKGDFSDVQKVSAPKFTKDSIIGDSLNGYFSIDPITGEKTPLIPGSSKFQAITNPLTGETQVFDPQSGQLSSGGFSPAPPGGFRTDRNNNPTAMTTDVAKSLGLVEGVDYVQGDKFPGNSNLYTAKLLGDPLSTTIKALDAAASSPNQQAFYTNSGKQRWSYIGISDSQWLSMSADQKKQVIAQMYKSEGGSGQLVGSISNASIETLAAQVLKNPQILNTLPDATKKAVINAIASQGKDVPQPLSETAQNKMRDAQATFNSADSLLASIEKLTNKVITANSSWDIPGQWLSKTIGGKTRSDSDAAVFADTISAFTSLLTRAAGEKGVLTDTDVARIKRALPSLFDTKQVAQQKLDQLRTIYSSIKNGTLTAYSPTSASSSPQSNPNDLRTKYNY